MISQENFSDIVEGIEEVLADLKTRIRESSVVAKGTKTFLRRYNMISQEKFSNAALGSALCKFGWSVGGSIQNSQGGHFRRDHRIPISAKAAGRRRGKISKGKGKALSGRPKGGHSSFTMKPRKEPRGK